MMAVAADEGSTFYLIIRIIELQDLGKRRSQRHAKFEGFYHQHVGAYAVVQENLSFIPQPVYQGIKETQLLRA